jgi:diguanylate cyclase (GGDEF)-like protein
VLRRLIDAGLEVQRGRPLEGPGAMLRCLPFVAAGLLAFLFLPLLPDPFNWSNLVAAALIPLILGSVPLVPWERLPAWVQAVPTLLVFVAVAVVRSTHESPIAAYTPVVFLPVFWFALYGSRGQLLVSIIAVGLAFAVPTPAIDGYPVTVPAAAVLWMVIAGIAGFTVSELARQREGLQARMARMARTDVLTGLPNRRAWEEELPREIQRAKRSGRPLCAALLDLDHFKQFNDTFGHEAGDDVLRELGQVLRDRVRKSDIPCRYGGEEFVLVFPDSALADTLKRVEQIRALVKELEIGRGDQPCDRISVSAGVAQAHEGGSTPSELLQAADDALYAAKQAGRDRVVAHPVQA